MNNVADKELLTVGTFKTLFKELFDESFDRKIEPIMARVDRRFSDLDRKMMDGFSMFNDKIDYVDEHLSLKIDELALTKADREEVFALHKRVAKLERKAA